MSVAVTGVSAMTAPAGLGIWVAELDQVPDDVLDVVNEEEHARARRLRVQGRQARRWLRHRGVLRHLASDLLHTRPEDVVCARPGRVGRAAGGCVASMSATHSGPLSAYVFSLRGDVGIDIEQDDPIRDWRAVVRLLAGPSQQAELLGTAEPLARECFLRWWTRREAALKAAGVGLGASRYALSPVAPPYEQPQPLHLDGAVLWMRDLPFPKGWGGSVAWW